MSIKEKTKLLTEQKNNRKLHLQEDRFSALFFGGEMKERSEYMMINTSVHRHLAGKCGTTTSDFFSAHLFFKLNSLLKTQHNSRKRSTDV